MHFYTIKDLAAALWQLDHDARKGRSGVTLILRGIPGSGKTRIAEALRAEYAQPRAAIISIDDHFTCGASGEYAFNITKLDEAHGQCIRRHTQLLTAPNAVPCLTIIDNTNSHSVRIAPYYAVAKAFGREAVVLTVEADLETCLKRQTHNAPRGVVQRMAARIGNATLCPCHWKRWTITLG